MKRLDGTVSLGGGYRISAPGISGQVELISARAPSSAAAGAEGSASLGRLGFAALEDALAASSDQVRTVVVEARRVAPLGRVDLRPSAMAGAIHLEVPKPPPSQRAVVLAVDEAGTATWHFPRSRQGPAPSGATKPVLEFEIPYREVSRRPTAGVSPPAIPGKLGRKLLKVVFYKAADVLVGRIGDFLVSRWEEKNRPTRLRWFTPDNYTVAGAGTIINPAELAALRDQRVLLFLHGTFSTSHGGFGGLPAETMAQLYKQYEGRVLAFDHATMASSPELNLQRLLAMLPPKSGMTFDVIAHSRGGLVARGLAGEFGQTPSGVSVRRAVLVGTPNHGTALADVDHLSALLERMTTALSLIPPAGPVGVIAETLQTVIAGVKFVGSSVAERLEGLMAMNPTSAFLQNLNSGATPTADYYGVASDFEPHEPGLLALVRGRIVDTTVDYVFGQAANDLVVPQLGVSQGPPPDDPAFPLSASHLQTFGSQSGIWHCSYFGAPATSARLLQWLAS
jgi:hypothetical protein